VKSYQASTQVGRMAGSVNAFNELSQYANSPSFGHMQNLLFSSLVVAVTIASNHFAYLQRDDQAELAWVAGLNTKMLCPWMVTYVCINKAQCRV